MFERNEFQKWRWDHTAPAGWIKSIYIPAPPKDFKFFCLVYGYGGADKESRPIIPGWDGTKKFKRYFVLSQFGVEWESEWYPIETVVRGEVPSEVKAKLAWFERNGNKKHEPS